MSGDPQIQAWWQQRIDTASSDEERLRATVHVLLEAMNMPLDFVANWASMDDQRLRNSYLSISRADVVAAVSWMLAQSEDVRAAVTRTIVAGPDSPEDLPRRLRACVESWPGCHSGGYDPRCCRFPKSCSPHAYPEAIAAHGESILEPADASVVTPPLSDLSQFELIVGEDDEGCAADLRCLRCPSGLTGWSAEVGGKTLAEIVTLAKHHEQEAHAE